MKSSPSLLLSSPLSDETWWGWKPLAFPCEPPYNGWGEESQEGSEEEASGKRLYAGNRTLNIPQGIIHQRHELRQVWLSPSPY